MNQLNFLVGLTVLLQLEQYFARTIFISSELCCLNYNPKTLEYQQISSSILEYNLKNAKYAIQRRGI